MKAINIQWDVDCEEELEGLPQEIVIPPYISEEGDAISDYITEQTGFCHKGFQLIGKNYFKRIAINEGICKEYLELLNEPGTMDEYETYSHTAVFSNGYQADIKLCSGGEDYNWTEAVLFNEKGGEVACSEPSDELLGLWEFDDGDNHYSVIVEIGREKDEFTIEEIVARLNNGLERTPEELEKCKQWLLKYQAKHYLDSKALDDLCFENSDWVFNQIFN